MSRDNKFNWSARPEAPRFRIGVPLNGLNRLTVKKVSSKLMYIYISGANAKSNFLSNFQILQSSSRFCFPKLDHPKESYQAPLPPLHLLLQCLISAPRLIYDFISTSYGCKIKLQVMLLYARIFVRFTDSTS